MQQNWSNVFDGVADANQRAVAAAAEFNKIATRAQGLLVRKQLSALETCLEAGTKHLKVASEIKDPQELVKRCTEVNVELGERLVATAQEALEIQVQARDALARWMERGIASAQDGAEVALRKPSASTRKTTRSRRRAA